MPRVCIYVLNLCPGINAEELSGNVETCITCTRDPYILRLMQLWEILLSSESCRILWLFAFLLMPLKVNPCHWCYPAAYPALSDARSIRILRQAGSMGHQRKGSYSKFGNIAKPRQRLAGNKTTHSNILEGGNLQGSGVLAPDTLDTPTCGSLAGRYCTVSTTNPLVWTLICAEHEAVTVIQFEPHFTLYPPAMGRNPEQKNPRLATTRGVFSTA
jgi:hypothetical protein